MNDSIQLDDQCEFATVEARDDNIVFRCEICGTVTPPLRQVPHRRCPMKDPDKNRRPFRLDRCYHLGPKVQDIDGDMIGCRCPSIRVFRCSLLGANVTEHRPRRGQRVTSQDVKQWLTDNVGWRISCDVCEHHTPNEREQQ